MLKHLKRQLPRHRCWYYIHRENTLACSSHIPHLDIDSKHIFKYLWCVDIEQGYKDGRRNQNNQPHPATNRLQRHRRTTKAFGVCAGLSPQNHKRKVGRGDILMGLDIACECGKIDFRAGSYSGFSEFRNTLAKAVGIALYEMEGFTQDGMEWTEQEPFYELLNHSDCGGLLTSRQCNELTKDFKLYKSQILSRLKKDSIDFEYFASKLDEWEEAVNHSDDECCALEFC
jgi:hypothetical protein